MLKRNFPCIFLKSWTRIWKCVLPSLTMMNITFVYSNKEVPKIAFEGGHYGNKEQMRQNPLTFVKMYRLYTSYENWAGSHPQDTWKVCCNLMLTMFCRTETWLATHFRRKTDIKSVITYYVMVIVRAQKLFLLKNIFEFCLFMFKSRFLNGLQHFKNIHCSKALINLLGIFFFSLTWNLVFCCG